MLRLKAIFKFISGQKNCSLCKNRRTKAPSLVRIYANAQYVSDMGLISQQNTDQIEFKTILHNVTYNNNGLIARIY